jgi:glycosyltransferase involved in cell wall biosynthesis
MDPLNSPSGTHARDWPAAGQALPRVSVIMPARNVERWISAAVESVLASSLTDFEFLISDDGSTDGTRAILQSYAARDSRIRLIDTPSSGPAEARNTLLALARGAFIAFQDSDDICHPHRFRLQLEFLENNRDFVGISSNFVLIREEMEFPGDTSKHEIMFRSPVVAVDQQKVFGPVIDFSFPASMVRAGSVKTLGGLRPYFTGAEDVDFNLRLADLGRLGNLQQALYAYRKHGMNTALRWPYMNIESGVLLRMFAARRRKGRADRVYARKPSFIRIFTSGLSPAEVIVCLFEIARLSLKRSSRIAKAVANRHWR